MNNPTFPEKIQEAKRRLKIPDLWRLLGYPGEPKLGTNNRAPWRDDKHPSLSLTADGILWHDFTEGIGGDAISFIQRACNVDRRTAMYRLIDMAFGGEPPVIYRAPVPMNLFRRRPKPEFPPDIHQGSIEEIDRLAKLRKLSVDGIQMASMLGLLLFCKWDFVDSWLVTDDDRFAGQVRRLDGKPIDDVKAKTLFNSYAQWPIGMANVHRVQNIALVEGGPDLLAACQFIHQERVAAIPVAMLGGAQSINPGALMLFSRKRVIIFAHNEKPKPILQGGAWITPEKSAGELAWERWRDQLVKVADSVVRFRFPEGVKDLNDLAVAQPATRVMQYEKPVQNSSTV